MGRFDLSTSRFEDVGYGVNAPYKTPQMESLRLEGLKFFGTRERALVFQNGWLHGCEISDLYFEDWKTSCLELIMEAEGDDAVPLWQAPKISNITCVRGRGRVGRKIDRQGDIHALLLTVHNAHITNIHGRDIYTGFGEAETDRVTGPQRADSCLVYVAGMGNIVDGVTGQNACGQNKYGLVQTAGFSPWYPVPDPTFWHSDPYSYHNQIRNVSYRVDDGFPGKGLVPCKRAISLTCPYTSVSGLRSWGGEVVTGSYAAFITLSDCVVYNRRANGFRLNLIGGTSSMNDCWDVDPQPEATSAGFVFAGYPKDYLGPNQLSLEGCKATDYHRMKCRPRRAVQIKGSAAPRISGLIGVDSTIDGDSPYVKPLWN